MRICFVWAGRPPKLPHFAARASNHRHVRRVTDSQRAVQGATECAPHADGADYDAGDDGESSDRLMMRPRHHGVLSPASTTADDMEVEDLAEDAPSGVATNFRHGMNFTSLLNC